MKKLNNYAILVLFVLSLTSIVGCSKKGEDDPFLSFKSRDARLAGEWALTSVDASTKSTSVYKGTTTETSSETTYSGKEQTTTRSKGDPITTKYTLSLVIEKNGTITYTYEGFNTKDVSTGISTIQGSWNWETTGKRKSAINIDITGPSAFPLMGTWDVSQLKNKEIIFSKSTFVKSSSTDQEKEDVSSTSLIFTGK